MTNMYTTSFASFVTNATCMRLASHSVSDLQYFFSSKLKKLCCEENYLVLSTWFLQQLWRLFLHCELQTNFKNVNDHDYIQIFIFNVSIFETAAVNEMKNKLELNFHLSSLLLSLGEKTSCQVSQKYSKSSFRKFDRKFSHQIPLSLFE